VSDAKGPAAPRSQPRTVPRTDGLLLYAPPPAQEPVRFVKGVGERGQGLLEGSKFRIATVQDLLQHYPRRHLDFSETKAIREVRAGDEVTVIGEVRRAQAPPPGRGRLPLRVMVHDGTSQLTVVFFNQPWRARQLPVGTTVALKGKISVFRGVRQMSAPLVDVLRDAGEIMRIVPQYPATAEIQSNWLRKVVKAAIEAYSPLADPLPESVRARYGFLDRTEALRGYHFPAQMSEVWQARRRLVFDELFTLQTGLAYRKRRIERDTVGIAHEVPGELDAGHLATRFLDSLPFRPTGAQLAAIAEIAGDMARSVPMNRLLQGEVGSGKTVVALWAALAAVHGGYQAAIMAPTEVLAAQHALTIRSLVESLAPDRLDGAGGPDRSARPAWPERARLQAEGQGQLGLFGGHHDPCGPGVPEVVLLTGSIGAARRRAALERIASGQAGIVVGTHALIQEGIEFHNLGLAVVDEQHRFGVRQRIRLREKAVGGATPDVLIMTATPIPRTLALTLYGDLDVSVLDELPKGRQPVRTAVVDESGRAEAYELVRREVRAGRQAYVITPLVDESDKLAVRSAEAEAERLATQVFPDLTVAKLHGKMRPAQKEAVMEQFRKGEVDVLISTTVVEVGVDVSNATVMLIEDADRFGLSQLHQLRGRIGRGSHASTCLLFTSALEEAEDETMTRQRLEAVASTTDGFELAQKDLELRGTGTIMGERQAGFSDLRLTHLLRDIEVLKQARDEAFALVDADPDLSGHPLIRQEMEGRFADRLDWLFHS
jgi:ATP-dependent DNA helicase RecG